MGFSSVKCWLRPRHQLVLSGIQLTSGLQGSALKGFVCWGTAVIRSCWSGEGGRQLLRLYKEPGGSELPSALVSSRQHSVWRIPCLHPRSAAALCLGVNQAEDSSSSVSLRDGFLTIRDVTNWIDPCPPPASFMHLPASISCSPSLLLPTPEERSVLLWSTPALPYSGRMVGFWVHRSPHSLPCSRDGMEFYSLAGSLNVLSPWFCENLVQNSVSVGVT